MSDIATLRSEIATYIARADAKRAEGDKRKAEADVTSKKHETREAEYGDAADAYEAAGHAYESAASNSSTLGNVLQGASAAKARVDCTAQYKSAGQCFRLAAESRDAAALLSEGDATSKDEWIEAGNQRYQAARLHGDADRCLGIAGLADEARTQMYASLASAMLKGRDEAKAV